MQTTHYSRLLITGLPSREVVSGASDWRSADLKFWFIDMFNQRAMDVNM